MTPADLAKLKRVAQAAAAGHAAGGRAWQAPSVVKVRLSGTCQDITAVAELLTGTGTITVLDQSGAYPNQRDPGMRVYLTVLVNGAGP